jgi:hypothetical protein
MNRITDPRFSAKERSSSDSAPAASVASASYPVYPSLQVDGAGGSVR